MSMEHIGQILRVACLYRAVYTTATTTTTTTTTTTNNNNNNIYIIIYNISSIQLLFIKMLNDQLNANIGKITHMHKITKKNNNPEHIWKKQRNKFYVNNT
jgi:hypothetical protein